MKQEIATESRASLFHSLTGNRTRVQKTRDTQKSGAPINGVSSGQKLRPKPVVSEPDSSAKTRKNQPKLKPFSGEEIEAHKAREMGRMRQQPVESYARLRRPRGHELKKVVDSDEEKKGLDEKGELQRKLDLSEGLVNDLHSEVAELRAQVESLQSLNQKLELQNRKVAVELAAAEAKLNSRILSANQSLDRENGFKKKSMIESVVGEIKASDQEMESPSEEVQRAEFKDIRKLIASKMEQQLGPKPMAIKQVPTPKTVQIQPKPPPICPPPPPPPPPPTQALSKKGAAMKKAPDLVEFYHLLTKREGKKDGLGSGTSSSPGVMSAHSSIIGEIQNRSSHMLAVRADVEKKGEFIKFVIKKIREMAFADMEEVLAFVDWLDTELSSLSDERAVLKHFDWPERKADAMREAAFEYRDLKRLELEVSSYEDDLCLPCETALKKMATLLDKSEQRIPRLAKLRDLVMPCYRDCKIPTAWMCDSGMVDKIKLASVKLAKKCMNRLSMELELVKHSERESAHEGLLLQGVRFAYRAHQFAGGLDAETLCAFEEIRRLAPSNCGGSRELFAGITP
ncbi:hypothetical protein AMTRI_Chr02g223990 [Amborella trichopoda]|uniref:Protein CHUP1, chloroplastic n=1 Tax=Amborella trichopoda TaxID=13333 RepID=W1P4Y9_AMBTC|nr:protein CHUP1, chloroplastic [Amborella trichopoda]ERN02030.1 hypothetical protein AMTR_s00045p00113980 [Amborella trichopoda]|eukprot:XP_006840355.1 protein CHUP1, chloroplastic [Amborella trichopoda]